MRLTNDIATGKLDAREMAEDFPLYLRRRTTDSILKMNLSWTKRTLRSVFHEF
jgi:hypothetical protein